MSRHGHDQGPSGVREKLALYENLARTLELRVRRTREREGLRAVSRARRAASDTPPADRVRASEHQRACLGRRRRGLLGAAQGSLVQLRLVRRAIGLQVFYFAAQ